MALQTSTLPLAVGWSIVKSILIVDDDETCADMLCDMLSRADRFIFTAFSAAQADRMLATRTFDLVLLDLSLPDGSGLDLLRRYAGFQRETRFVIVTGDESSSVVLDSMGGEAFDFVRKPFVVDELREWVDRWLEPGDRSNIEFHSVTPHWVEMSIPCTIPAVDRAGRFLWNLQSDLPTEFREQVTDCLRELLMNAIEWGGRFDESRKVRISYIRTADLMQIRVSDPGNGFSFADLSHAAVGQSTPDPLAYAHIRQQKGIRPGGLGLMIVRSIADELLYNEVQNEVLFVKYLPNR
jgi:CheY-like chemotaxis protein/anti-sigma regulatory factor (Ser/Thr protein kinase)